MRVLITIVVVVLASSLAHAVDIVTVPVGNPGNAGELSGAGSGAGGYGPDRICGAVGYSYKMAKFEVKAGQYTAFLTAVAGVDAYGLYNASMWSDTYGCKIERYEGNGTQADPYKYRVASDWANRPVNYVSYWDSCRFANWLHNGQGSGDTETGAYTLTLEHIANNTVTRNADWKWAVTSEDEWYKSAYHKNDGVTGNYWDYPTGTDSMPGRDMSETTNPGNNANYYGNPYPIDPPHYTTVAGEFELSDSPYGTFDQGGNVWEWTEGVIGTDRVVRGGSFVFCGTVVAIGLHAAERNHSDEPSYEGSNVGFRVAEVPEPATAGLFLLGGLLVARGRRALR